MYGAAESVSSVCEMLECDGCDPAEDHCETYGPGRADPAQMDQKTIDMLNNMQDYLIENRIIARRTSMLIDGRNITDDELKAERIKLEAMKNGK